MLTEEARRADDDNHAVEVGRRAVVDRIPGALWSLAVAVLLVVLAYPEVIVADGSLAPTDLLPVVTGEASQDSASVYPAVDGEPRRGVLDLGAKVWQVVPATKFMERAIHDGESPWWNPYAAAGSLGPETLVDGKLSPYVLLTALLGASALAYTVVGLFFAVLALYCIQQLFTRSLRLDRLAATAACGVFLLNGFAVSEVASAVGWAYMLAPVVLYTLVEFHRSRRPIRFLLAVAAYVALLLTSFIPVIVLMLALIHLVAFLVGRQRTLRIDDTGRLLDDGVAASGRGSSARTIARHLLVPATSLVLVAFAYLPVIDALRRGGGDIDSYQGRELAWTGLDGVVKLVLPGVDVTENWMTYVGIGSFIVIATALPRAREFLRRLLLAMAIVTAVAVGQHVGVPGLRELGELPFLRAVRAEYWAALAGLALALGVGAGVASLRRTGGSVVGASVAGGAGLVALVVSPLVTPRLEWPALVVSALVLVAGMLLVVALHRRPEHRVLLVVALVGLVGLELVAFQNHARALRVDKEDDPPAYVGFVQDNLGDGRIMSAGRGALYPEWGTVFQIPDVGTINTTQVPEYREFYLHHINPGEGEGLFLRIGEDESVTFSANPDALNLLSVRYLVVDEDLSAFDRAVATRYPLAFHDQAAGIKVYENPEAFPAAYLSPVLVQGSGSTTWSREITQTEDVDLLAEADDVGLGSGDDVDSVGEVEIVERENDRVTLRVDADAPAVLVLTDSQHPNWRASIDGEAVEVGRVNEVVRGVVVPAGSSTVVFEYHSTARDIGTAISLVGLVLVGIGITAYAVRRRSRPSEPDDRGPVLLAGTIATDVEALPTTRPRAPAPPSSS